MASAVGATPELIEDGVHGLLVPLIEATKADELMVSTMIYDHGARRHSYEVLAQAFGLASAAAPAQAAGG